MAKDDDLLPKKATKSAPKTSARSRAISPQMFRIIQITRAIGLLFGGFVTLVAFMGVVGLVTDNFWARFILATVVLIGLPALASDRLLKRTKIGGGSGTIVDVFAIVYLALACLLVAGDTSSRVLFVREGDRHARSGARSFARLAYLFGGVAPIYPDGSGAQKAAGPDAGATK